MKYGQIMELLTKEAQKLKDVHFVMEWEQIAAKFVKLQNAYCEAGNNYDDIIYTNDDENLQYLLPSNPVEAFTTGLLVRDNYYSPTDEWLSLDGYGHPVTAANTTLVNDFIFIEDITSWLEELAENEQRELLNDFLED